MRFGTALIFSLVSFGCTPADENQAIHFLMWKSNQPKPMEEAISLFEERHPGIQVIRHIGSENASEYYRELTTKLRNKDPDLDVFFLDVIWPPELVARGYIEDLTRRFSKEAQRQFFPGPLSAVTVGEGVYAVPFNIDVGLLFYRKDLLDQYGFKPPVTWDEMLQQIDFIIEAEGEENPGLVGYAGQFEKYEGLVCNVLEFIESGGGSFLDGQGRPSVNTPEVIEAIHFIRDELIHNEDHPRRATDYLLTAKEQDTREIFMRGEAIFLRNWPETWGIVNDPERSKVQGRIGMSPLPAFEGGKPVGTLGGWQLGIASHSKRQDLAWQFIEFMTSHEIQLKLAVEKAQTMARLTIYDDDQLLSAMPHFGQSGSWGSSLREAAMLASPRPQSIRYNAVSERIQRYLHNAIRDPESDIPALMAQLSLQLEKELAQTAQTR